MKKILVTGGTTFVSKFTAKYFADCGYDVYVLNRGTKEQVSGVTLIKCDRHDLGDVVRDYSFDAVLDITSYNADDINALLDGLGSFGTYIFISSSAVYPETESQPFSEESKVSVNKFWGKYGTDKIAAEKALLLGSGFLLDGSVRIEPVALNNALYSALRIGNKSVRGRS